MLRHEVEEIGGARLRAGEAAELRARLELARHGEAITRGAAHSRAALDGEGSGARDGPLAARPRGPLAGADRPSLRGGRDRLAGLEAELEDAAREVRRLAEGVDHDRAASRGRGAPRSDLLPGAPIRRRRGRGDRARRARGGGDRAAGGARGGAPAARGGRRAPPRRGRVRGRELSDPPAGRRGRPRRRGGRGPAQPRVPAGAFEVASAGARPARTRRRSSSTATRSRSMPPAPTRSSSVRAEPG